MKKYVGWKIGIKNENVRMRIRKMRRFGKGNDEELKMVRNKKENEESKRRWKKMVEEKEWKEEMVRRKDERKVKIKKGWRLKNGYEKKSWRIKIGKESWKIKEEMRMKNKEKKGEE